MKFGKYTFISFLLVFTSVTNAQTLLINDFDSYADTAELQTEWGAFGAASGGAPELPVGTGVNGTNSARYALAWNAGNNANMNYFAFPVQDLSIYESLDVSVYLETISGFSSPTNPTTLLLAIEVS